jgi:hypothetical protein
MGTEDVKKMKGAILSVSQSASQPVIRHRISDIGYPRPLDTDGWATEI